MTVAVLGGMSHRPLLRSADRVELAVEQVLAERVLGRRIEILEAQRTNLAIEIANEVMSRIK